MYKIKKFICVFLSLIPVVSIAAAGNFTAAAAAEETRAYDQAFFAASGYYPLSKTAEHRLLDQEDELPDQVDLRNFNGKNYVTPVKKQDPFGSCWAFGIAGAAEISFLHDNGLGVPAGEVNDLIDISEKYINWYMFHAITEDDTALGCVPASQVGEGVDPFKAEETNRNAVYEFGGNGGFASNFFASGFGPVDEDEEVDGSYPYLYRGKNGWRNNDEMSEEERAACIGYFALKQKDELLPLLLEMGTISSEEEYDAWFEANWEEGDCNKNFLLPDGSGYAAFDDWTLPLNSKYRNVGMLSYFKRSYVLPAPAVGDENGDYKFNPLGIYAMKSELFNGHGIAISFLADQSQPGQESGDDGYMNTTNWAQYYTGDVRSNHTVTVVGYDDNYPKENFTRIAEGEVVEGSTPPADGAFIVKNSWGALSEEDKATATYDENGKIVYQNPNAAAWGIEDTGYFYLSYYDNSILAAESYEFYNREETEYTRINYDQYDLLQPAMYDRTEGSEKELSANVFEAEEDEYLSQISYMTIVPMTNVHYAVYKDVDGSDPTSGVLLEQGDTINELGGYQRLDLRGEYFLKKGERYSVVITMTTEEDDGTLSYSCVYSYLAIPIGGVSLNAVVNPGESYAYTGGQWTDWTEIKGEIENAFYQKAVEEFGSEEAFLKRVPLGKDFVKVDNLPIKAYLLPAELHDSDRLLGDADCDGAVSVLDATAIQKKLASMEPSSFNENAADVERDGKVTILDATYIQKYLASLPCPEGIGERMIYTV
ncbi:MAG: hypothetical protein IJH32_10900 [Ruminococcus sp.]|nr:hypothetical protein [Ruminococcus sp.]